SDRSGPFDAWVTQVGSDQFVNLTNGEFPALGLGSGVSRSIGFTPDGAHVWIYRTTGNPAVDGTWLVPTMGGNARPFVHPGAEVVWSPDRARTLYRTGDGDPIYVADANGNNPKRIFLDK